MKQNSIEIKCSYDALVDTDSLIPNPRNPNKHSDNQLELLSKIIKYQGFRRVIVVSNRSGFVVVGHARLEAAKRLKMPQCPVDYQDYASEADEYADMIADNRIAELADTSLPDLKDLLQELDTGAFDMDLTGFDADALENLLIEQDIQGRIGKVIYDQAVQLEAAKEYIVIMFEDREDWEKAREKLGMGRVKRGGYREDSPFNAIGDERVITWERVKGKLK